MSSEGGKRSPIGPAHEELGNRMRDLRKRRGHSNLRRFAEEVGVGASTLSEVEKGITTPSEEFLLKIIDALGGDKAQFRRLHAAAVKEQQARRVQRKKFRAGEPIEEVSHGLPEPRVEVVMPDGVVTEMKPVDVRPEDINLSGPFYIEELEEHHLVNAHRVIERTIYVRVLRATESGLQTFSYAFDEDPSALMERIVIHVQPPAVVTEVLRRAKNGYIFNIHLPKPLEANERYRLRFSITSEGGQDFSDFGILLKQQMVQTERLLLTAEFRSDEHPVQVGWFQLDYPAASTLVEPPSFEEDKILPRPPSDVYEKEFKRPTGPGQIVGIGWKFAD